MGIIEEIRDLVSQYQLQCEGIEMPTHLSIPFGRMQELCNATGARITLKLGGKEILYAPEKNLAIVPEKKEIGGEVDGVLTYSGMDVLFYLHDNRPMQVWRVEKE